MNFALIDVTGPMYNEHVAAALQAPFHCVKRHPPAGVARSSSRVPNT